MIANSFGLGIETSGRASFPTRFALGCTGCNCRHGLQGRATWAPSYRHWALQRYVNLARRLIRVNFATMRGRSRSIDTLRGLAAVAVVFRHSSSQFMLGSIGVDFFFVISGLVMANVSQGSTPAHFLKDRAWRIFPTYWLALLPWLAIAIGAGQFSYWRAVGSIMLWPAWFGVDSSYLGVSWSLVYELLFYLAVAAAIYLRSVVLPLTIFALALFVRPLWTNPVTDVIGSPIIFEFLFGAIIAHVRLSRLVGAGSFVAGLLWLANYPNIQLEGFAVAWSYGPAFQRVLLWGVPAAMIVYGSLCHERLFKGPVAEAMLVVGAASYSIYLVHPLVTTWVELPWAMESAFAIGAGISFWWLVERRLKRRPQFKIWRRRPVATELVVRSTSSAKLLTRPPAEPV